MALLEARLVHRECCLCGETDNLHVHHILFRSQGGDDVAANLDVVCLPEHEAIHLRNSQVWAALGEHVRANRPDTVEYLEEKLGSNWDVYFD